MRMWISCLSSSSIMAPRYPSLLSENLGEAINFRVSIWNRHVCGICECMYMCEIVRVFGLGVCVCVLVADLSKVCRVTHHVNVEQLGHVASPGIIVVPLEGCPNVRTLLRYHISLILSCLARPNHSDQVPDPYRPGHSGIWVWCFKALHTQ